MSGVGVGGWRETGATTSVARFGFFFLKEEICYGSIIGKSFLFDSISPLHTKDMGWSIGLGVQFVSGPLFLDGMQFLMLNTLRTQ